MPLKVLASRARCPSFPGAFAAAFYFLAGIFCPSLTPSSLRKAPGFLMAFWIQPPSFNAVGFLPPGILQGFIFPIPLDCIIIIYPYLAAFFLGAFLGAGFLGAGFGAAFSLGSGLPNRPTILFLLIYKQFNAVVSLHHIRLANHAALLPIRVVFSNQGCHPHEHGHLEQNPPLPSGSSGASRMLSHG